jgi:hypothetical protein
MTKIKRREAWFDIGGSWLDKGTAVEGTLYFVDHSKDKGSDGVPHDYHFFELYDHEIIILKKEWKTLKAQLKAAEHALSKAERVLQMQPSIEKKTVSGAILKRALAEYRRVKGG